MRPGLRSLSISWLGMPLWSSGSRRSRVICPGSWSRRPGMPWRPGRSRREALRGKPSGGRIRHATERIGARRGRTSTSPRAMGRGIEHVISKSKRGTLGIARGTCRTRWDLWTGRNLRTWHCIPRPRTGRLLCLMCCQPFVVPNYLSNFGLCFKWSGSEGRQRNSQQCVVLRIFRQSC